MKLRRIPEALAWWVMLKATRLWASRYMDQWEKVKFDTPNGRVYLTISRKDPYPDSFDKV